MELTLPVSPEVVTGQHKALVMRWHPDRNPGNPESTRKVQDLGDAMELLTGADLSRLPSAEIERATYQQVLQHSSITLPDGIKLNPVRDAAVRGRVCCGLDLCGELRACGAQCVFRELQRKVRRSRLLGTPTTRLRHRVRPPPSRGNTITSLYSYRHATLSSSPK